MTIYVATIVFVVVSMLIMIVSVYINSAFTNKRKLFSILLLLVIIICAIGECLGILMDDGTIKGSINLHKVVKFVELSLAPAIGVIPAYIFVRKKKVKIIDLIVIGVLIINCILQFISMFTGFIFDVNDLNVYSHEKCYFLYLISYAITMLYFVVTAVVVFSSHNILYVIPNILVVVFILTSIVLQLVSNVKIDWLAIGISTILLFKFYGDVLANTDALTNLLNRLEFENSVKNLNRNTYIIYCDIDHFKLINDTYGHIYGDNVLIATAKCLKKTYGKFGSVYRYGGDEFCVILKRNTDKIEELNKTFKNLIANENKEDAKFPSISLGYALYKPKEDEFLDILDKADQNMYENKEHTNLNMD